MGNSESTTATIVSIWGDKEREINVSDTRVDIVEIRTNRRSELFSIGIVRPIKGRAQAKLTIRNLKEKGLAFEETFDVRANFLEERCIFNLPRKVLLQPGYVYEVKVIYEGAPCYTYSEMNPKIKLDDDYEVLLRRNLDDSRNSNQYRLQNMITDIGCSLAEKGRECC